MFGSAIEVFGILIIAAGTGWFTDLRRTSRLGGVILDAMSDRILGGHIVGQN